MLAGRKPDRPPFSFWYHFPPDQVAGTAAVNAHLDLLNRYGMDVLKVMNDNLYPHSGRIARVEDLASLVPLKGDEAGFGEQLAVLSALRTAIGRACLHAHDDLQRLDGVAAAGPTSDDAPAAEPGCGG